MALKIYRHGRISKLSHKLQPLFVYKVVGTGLKSIITIMESDGTLNTSCTTFCCRCGNCGCEYFQTIQTLKSHVPLKPLATLACTLKISLCLGCLRVSAL